MNAGPLTWELGPGEVVLIVEDSDGDARLVELMLAEAFGPQVSISRECTLAAALDFLARGRAACVLLDLGLPDADGVETVQRLVSLAPGAAIVVLTGDGDANTGMAAVEAGAQDYLVKGSATAETLGRAVRYALVRNRAEHALANANEIAHLGGWEIDLATNAMVWSDELYRLFGFDKDQPAEARALLSRVHPADRSMVETSLRRSFDDVTPFSVEHRVVLPDGTIRWMLTQGSFHFTEAKLPALARGTVRDITDQRLAVALAEKVEQLRASEAALRRTGERFRALVEGLPDAVVGTDVDGCVTIVNAATERLFGYQRDEILGRPVEVLLPTNDDEVAAQRADGVVIPVAITLSALETDEGPVVLASVRDISETRSLDAARAELERQLHQSQRLESLGQLAGGIAHDFNNLLMVIKFSAELMSDALDDAPTHGLDTAGLSKGIDQIDRAATSAANLTRQLLLFSRSQPVLTEPIDLNDHVSQIEELLRRSIEENIDLVVDLGADLPAVVADAGRLEQLLVNLVVNARDAMPEGGRVTVRTSGAGSSGPGATGPMVRLEVADTGPGMEPEVIERAFEPFFSTKPQGRGTGLGLATVYGIITDLGGTIELDSTLGRGTRVIMELPATDELPKKEAARAAIGGAGERLLLAEDEDDLRGTLAEMLQGAGYGVVSAGSGEAALDAFRRDDFDLLITDVMMPGMSGRQLADELWSDHPALRVLFMSGYTNRALEGVDDLGRTTDFVPKPVDRQQLLAHIRALLDQPASAHAANVHA